MSTSQETLKDPAMDHHNLFAGSNIGHIKGVDFQKMTYRNFSTVKKCSKLLGITSMCWGSKDESLICASRLNGSVILHDLITDSFSPLNFTQGPRDGHLKVIKIHDGNLISAFGNGVVKIFPIKHNMTSDQEIDHTLAIDTYLNGEGKQLQCMNHNEFVPNTIVTGGNENCLKVWDITATEKPIFTAKNVKNNWLNLRVPVWVTKAQFYPGSNKIVCGTGYGDVRLYDPSSSQRRPVIEVKCGEHPITGFCLRPNSDYHAYIGDTTGFIATVDLRKKLLINSFRGCKGGVTDIVAHPKYPVFSVSSVDRYVYNYDPDQSRDVIKSLYLKSSVNCLLYSSSWRREDYGHVSNVMDDNESRPSIEAVDKHDDCENDSDDDEREDVWDTMEVVGSKKRAHGKETEASTSKHKKLKK